MRERKKPSQSWVARTRYELEHEAELLAERLAMLKEIRQKKERGETLPSYSSK